MHDDELDSTAIDAAERINDALDAIAQGASPAFHLHRLDDATARTIDHFQKLSSHAGAPVPAGTFVNQLREDLMLTSDSTLPAVAAKPTTSRNRSMRRFIRSESEVTSEEARLLRRPWWGAVEAAAAVLLVIVLAGTLLYGQRQLPPTPVPNHYAIAPQASPSAMLAAVSTPEASPALIAVVPGAVSCDAKPGTAATPDLIGTPTTETLLPWPTTGDRPAIQGWGALLPEEVPVNFGIVVDIETVTEITAATNELLACVESGDVARTKALLSDDYLRRLELLAPSEGGRTNQDSPRTFVPLAATSEPIPGIHVTDVRRLPDGRVTAQLTPYNAMDSGVIPHFQYIFVRVGDRWLVDEAVPVANYPSTQITITDAGFSPKNISLAPQKSKMMNFTVRNAGTTTHSFTIPDLNISVDVAPGETQRIQIQLRPGTFSVYSGKPGDVEAGLTGTLTILPGVAPTPIPGARSPEASVSINERMVAGKTPINLRSQPDASSAVVTVLASGSTVIVLSTSSGSDLTPINVEKGGELWFFVQVNDGTVGWIREADTIAAPAADATQTSIDTQIKQTTLSPNSIPLTIQVDLAGILRGDPVAMDRAWAELDRVLAPYVDGSNCQIGFALISSRSKEIGDGVQLSDAISQLIQIAYPSLLPKSISGDPSLISESIAVPGTTPIGEVQLQLFLNMGCQPAPATPVATPVAS